MCFYLHNFELGATDTDAETLADDLAGVDDVVEHGLVDGSEGLGPLTTCPSNFFSRSLVSLAWTLFKKGRKGNE